MTDDYIHQLFGHVDIVLLWDNKNQEQQLETSAELGQQIFEVLETLTLKIFHVF